MSNCGVGAYLETEQSAFKITYLKEKITDGSKQPLE